MKEQNERRPVQDPEATIRELDWPDGLPAERLVASVYDWAIRAGMIEAELILGYAHDRTELPGRATPEKSRPPMRAFGSGAISESAHGEQRPFSHVCARFIAGGDGSGNRGHFQLPERRPRFP